jgi:hypothetical protein
MKFVIATATFFSAHVQHKTAKILCGAMRENYYYDLW